MDNRQQLLDCALYLFSQRGYDAVGVSEVVEAAGVTKPTLYYYFSSKRGLLDALLKRETVSLLTDINQAAVYQRDLTLTLENINRVYFESALRHSAFYRMQLAMVFSPPESESSQAIRSFTREQIKILERVFIQASQDHGNLQGRHKRLAAGYLGVVNSVTGLYLNDEIELTEDVVYQTVRQFMHGIFS